MPFYEREKELLEVIEKAECISMQALLKNQYTSVSTLRRDLIKLEEKGLILRTRGGVMAVKKSPDDKIAFFLRESEKPLEKKLIAQKAAKLVKDGDTVMLDASTSAYVMIPFLAEKRNLIVITNGVKALAKLSENHITCIGTGGNVVHSCLAFVGEDALRTIAEYNADFCCRGLSEDGKITDIAQSENAVRRKMIEHAKSSYLLCTSDKIGKTCYHNLCTADDITGIIQA